MRQKKSLAKRVRTIFGAKVLNEALPSPNNPYLRQLDFWNPSQHKPKILVVGAGGIGSWVVVQLAKLGVSRITVYDADHVSPHNLSTTVYRPADIGKLKVEALAGTIRRMGLPTDIRTRPVLYHGQSLRGFDVVVSAVDSMAGRSLIFREARRQRVPFYVDGRIGGENFRSYSIRPNSKKDRRLYKNTIVSDEKASELPCTGQAIVQVNTIVSGLMVNSVVQWITKRKYNPEIIAHVGSLSVVIAPPQGGRRVQSKVRTRREEKLRRGRTPHRTHS